MRNPRTGEQRTVKIGWSWTLFLFAGFLGLPLFLRKLYAWGGVFLVLWVVNFFIQSVSFEDPDEARVTKIGFGLMYLALECWIGAKGNEMTAKNYLDQGWVFSHPDSESTRLARQRWSLTT